MRFLDLFRRKSQQMTAEQLLVEMKKQGLGSQGDDFGLSAVFSCAKVISESIGQLPLSLYERQGETRVSAHNHSLSRLLTVNPNEFQTIAEYKEMVGLHLALRGNHYAHINRLSSGEVYELLPLDPDAVTPKFEDWKLTYEVNTKRGKDVLLPKDILHIKLFTFDGVNGISPLRQNRETLINAHNMRRHSNRTFGDGGRTATVISTAAQLKKEQRDELRTSWDSIFDNDGHATAILGGDAKVQRLGLTAEDLQYIEQSKFSRSEIAGIYRVPPHMIGDLEKATFSNIEHQGTEFVTACLMPYLVKIEQRLVMSLLPQSERSRYFAKFNVNALMRGDMKSRSDFYTKQIQNGALSPNEVRALEDMNPREGGDIYLTPLNMAINGKPIGEQSGNEDEN